MEGSLRTMTKAGSIRAGVGGWTFAPWRGVFYPKGLPHAQELSFASRHLTSIEVNGTFYRTQTPATFAKWAREVPDGFVFSLKGPRYATNRRVLGEAGDSINRFLESGPLMLGDRLGPLLWQFAPTKKFDEADFGAFLELLPAKMDGKKLQHVVEVRHPSFCTPAFVALLRRFSIPVVYAEHETYPEIADVTGDFVYARLQRSQAEIDTGYAAGDLDRFARLAKAWAAGEDPDDVPHVAPKRAPKKKRDVFVFMISGAKVRAPAAATALIARL